ncbi:membrane protein insertase YidC [Cellulomonas fimi]|uniref:Membrane protein insertase YidC n=1 Tax=Cellulomonas fimi (strain ATCC 484 / DSM 20113 / JCM 1341 / CCUG 24087 / LMG 16345 / NBRC 15513 / NCIMB 8980 / NCTC 7547 / NRS-133) TaxID=590998 RepID=F4H7Y7_CELFA|nr:membrane protein insertase YidC [Cellulomonas fimi]AEE46948.1 membrane protein insertase, YidC/Oxa1 family [Cellulomonas fimi ATCC 484]NNH08198.1 membrane protein insertase YidC [Cellulomonas fimi]VEH34650.1 Membrane protein YidC 1 [Cellulomonas fimi]
MDLFALPLVATALDAAYRALMGLTDLLEPLAGGASAALAVVLVTLLVRAALIPVGVSQAKAEATRARLAPRIAALQRRHRHDPQELQRATMQLYADEGTTPLAGCLPMLAQAPVVGLIYAVFVHTRIADHGNALLGQTLAGVPLGSTLAGALTGGTTSASVLVVLGLVVLVIAVVGELTRRAVAPGGRLAPAAPPVTAGAGAGPGGAAPLAGAGVQRVLGAMQFASAVVACFVPLAAGLYLLVTVWWTFAQRLLLRRRYPLADSTTPA